MSRKKPENRGPGSNNKDTLLYHPKETQRPKAAALLSC